ncbi:Der1-like family-domain-containing protein [Blastocladiella britannica]|nr:Der1-like family-domain-containing protein [Blastocladiella britannica]
MPFTLQNPSPGNPVTDFIFGLPPVTRALFAGTVGTTLLANFAIPIQTFLLYWPAVTQKWQLWRLLSCFFVGKLGFNWAMGLYFLYRNSIELERGKYAGRSAEFAWVVMLIMAASLAAGYFFELAVLAEPLMMALVYLWSNDSPHTSVGFMFGLQFQAMYLPWVLAGWDLLMTGSFPVVKLMGIVIGHGVHYAMDIYPSSNNGAALLPMPSFLTNVFPQDPNGPTVGQAGFAVQPPRATGAAPNLTTAGRRWAGTGQRLGGS